MVDCVAEPAGAPALHPAGSDGLPSSAFRLSAWPEEVGTVTGGLACKSALPRGSLPGRQLGGSREDTRGDARRLWFPAVEAYLFRPLQRSLTPGVRALGNFLRDSPSSIAVHVRHGDVAALAYRKCVQPSGRVDAEALVVGVIAILMFLSLLALGRSVLRTYAVSQYIEAAKRWVTSRGVHAPMIVASDNGTARNEAYSLAQPVFTLLPSPAIVLHSTAGAPSVHLVRCLSNRTVVAPGVGRVQGRWILACCLPVMAQRFCRQRQPAATRVTRPTASTPAGRHAAAMDPAAGARIRPGQVPRHLPAPVATRCLLTSAPTRCHAPPQESWLTRTHSQAGPQSHTASSLDPQVPGYLLTQGVIQVRGCLRDLAYVLWPWAAGDDSFLGCPVQDIYLMSQASHLIGSCMSQVSRLASELMFARDPDARAPEAFDAAMCRYAFAVWLIEVLHDVAAASKSLAQLRPPQQVVPGSLLHNPSGLESSVCG